MNINYGTIGFLGIIIVGALIAQQLSLNRFSEGMQEGAKGNPAKALKALKAKAQAKAQAAKKGASIASSNAKNASNAAKKIK